MLETARQDGLLPDNPTAGLTIQKVLHLKRETKKTRIAKWHILKVEQQNAIIRNEALGHERWIIAFALCTGMRSGEQWTLHLNDVHLDHEHPYVYVRYGGWRHGTYYPPKNNQERKCSSSARACTRLRNG